MSHKQEKRGIYFHFLLRNTIKTAFPIRTAMHFDIWIFEFLKRLDSSESAITTCRTERDGERERDGQKSCTCSFIFYRWVQQVGFDGNHLATAAVAEPGLGGLYGVPKKFGGVIIVVSWNGVFRTYSEIYCGARSSGDSQDAELGVQFEFGQGEEVSSKLKIMRK